MKIKIILTLLSFFISTCLFSKENKIIIASTTSTHDTGLLEKLNDIFKNRFNIKVQVLALGTGQAIKIAKDGNAEILLVHHTPSEIEFVNDGYGLLRYKLMYNDYVLVGPKTDNEICNSVLSKFNKIYENKKIFISRGDDSGTHKKELELWELNNISPFNKKNKWYLNVGQGMGVTLLIANEKYAYTLSDRSSWISFNKKNNLKIVCENDPPLYNQYGIILVNPKMNKNLNFKDALTYINWLTSDQAKNIINSYKKEDQQLFFYNHH